MHFYTLLSVLSVSPKQVVDEDEDEIFDVLALAERRKKEREDARRAEQRAKDEVDTPIFSYTPLKLCPQQ